MDKIFCSDTVTGSSDTTSGSEGANSNHLYFYSGVETDTCLNVKQQIRKLDISLQTEKLLRETITEVPIWLHVQSGGGGVFPAFGLVDQIKSTKTPIYSVVEGCAASAATIISMACSKRFITKSSFMMIHQISAGAWGKYEDLIDRQHQLDMMMETFIKFYKSNSKMTTNKIKGLLKRDSWFNAEECLALGLADEIKD